MSVSVKNYSVQALTKMSQAVRSGLIEAGAEVASHANSNVQMKDDAGQKLRGSYAYEVNMAGDAVTIGTPLEEGYWEEFGTGSHADIAKNGGVQGRPEWWVYVTNETPRATVPVYLTEEQAQAIASGLRASGKDAHASDGDDPNYTLETAFIEKEDDVKRAFENNLRMGMN